MSSESSRLATVHFTGIPEASRCSSQLKMHIYLMFATSYPQTTKSKSSQTGSGMALKHYINVKISDIRLGLGLEDFDHVKQEIHTTS